MRASAASDGAQARDRNRIIGFATQREPGSPAHPKPEAITTASTLV